MAGIGEIFASNLQTHRKRLGISQDQLGAKLNVAAGTVSRWENGLMMPTAETIDKIAQALHLAPWRLFVPKDVEEHVQRTTRTPAWRLEAVLSELRALMLEFIPSGDGGQVVKTTHEQQPKRRRRKGA